MCRCQARDLILSHEVRRAYAERGIVILLNRKYEGDKGLILLRFHVIHNRCQECCECQNCKFTHCAIGSHGATGEACVAALGQWIASNSERSPEYLAKNHERNFLSSLTPCRVVKPGRKRASVLLKSDFVLQMHLRGCKSGRRESCSPPFRGQAIRDAKMERGY